MKLIQLIDSAGDNIGIIDISECHIEDHKIQECIIEAFEKAEDVDEYLDENFGIRRVFIDEELTVNI